MAEWDCSKSILQNSEDKIKMMALIHWLESLQLMLTIISILIIAITVG